MSPFLELGVWVLKVLPAGVVAFFWWHKKRDKEMLDNHTVRLVKVEENLVTELRVREIVKEEVAPMLLSINEVKGLIQANTSVTQHLMLELAEDKGFRRGKGEQCSLQPASLCYQSVQMTRGVGISLQGLLLGCQCITK